MRLRRCVCYIVPLFFFFSASACVSNVHSEGYKGFSLLDPDECVPLEKGMVLQLPADWHKYAEFVKVCALKPKKDQPGRFSIVSVFADAYYDAQPIDYSEPQKTGSM